MDKRNRLTLSMGIFYMIVILLFGLIIINEKKKDLLIPKIEKEINTYIKENYKDELDSFKYTKIKRHDNTYILKVSNKKNNDLYFEVSYNNKKITDTYKKDYLEGRTINKSIETYLNEIIDEKKKENKNLYSKYIAIYNTKLNECTKYVKNNLLKKKYDLPIYTIDIEITTNSDIKDILSELNTYTKKIGLNPKKYHITINNKNNLTKSIEITIEKELLDNQLDEISSIIKENKKDELNKYNIEIKHLN